MAYLQINRKLFNHFLWTEHRVWSKFEAWIDLIQLVSYTENNDKIINGVVVKWGRGEYPVSYSFLSQRWNWTAQRTRGYIQLLKSNKQINTRTTSVATILTLCNYDQYNPKQQADNIETTSAVTSGQQADNKRTTISKESKEDNKVNKSKEDNTPPPFEDFKTYALENNPDVSIQSLELKYKSWVENNWRDGNNKKIVNWKSKILNTLPYLKNKNDGSNKQRSGRNEQSVNAMWDEKN